MAYCESCKKIVKPLWNTEYDETGETFDFPLCPECDIKIPYCYDCHYWHPDSQNTPLGQTMGTCSRYVKHRKRTYAFTLACGHFGREG